MIYVIGSLFNVEDWAELQLRDFTVHEVVVKLKDAEREKVLASCCAATDAEVLSELRRRYNVNVVIPGDTMDPELRSPEDAIVVVKQDVNYSIGKRGFAMVPLDIRLYARRK
ncbi:MAG: hypothetical protein Q7R85_04775 [bacterium]|nr:hypothetical protein [bacterium]